MEDQTKKHLTITAVIGILAVTIGAFGAHGLKPRISTYQLGIFETGVSYHFYHVMAMLGVAILSQYFKGVWIKRSFYAFMIGILLFSGSLYMLAIREVIGLSTYKWLGALTPIGGLFFIAGWVCLIMVVRRSE